MLVATNLAHPSKSQRLRGLLGHGRSLRPLLIGRLPLEVCCAARCSLGPAVVGLVRHPDVARRAAFRLRWVAHIQKEDGTVAPAWAGSRLS